MKTASILKNVEFKEKGPGVSVLLDTTFTKEIRITLKKGQEMKEHQTPYPIVVQLVDGQLGFGIPEGTLKLESGDLIALDGGVPHSLLAIEESIVRLTLTKSDEASRVKKVVGE